MVSTEELNDRRHEGHERCLHHFVRNNTRNCSYIFLFQAGDGIRDRTVTGVQTCALPISCQAEVATVDDDVLPYGQLEVEGVLLRHDTEARPDFRAVRDRIEAEDAQRPAGMR